MTEQGLNSFRFGVPQTYTPVYICGGEHVSVRAESNVQHRRLMVECVFLCSCAGVPQAVPCRQDLRWRGRLVARAEGDAQNAACMPAQRSVKISGAGVPQSHRAVGARRCKQSTVGAKGDTGDAVRVAAERGSNTSGQWHSTAAPYRARFPRQVFRRQD